MCKIDIARGRDGFAAVAQKVVGVFDGPGPAAVKTSGKQASAVTAD